LRNTNVSSNMSLIFALCGRMIIPLWEKIRSTGADVAGVQSSLWNSGRIRHPLTTSVANFVQLAP